MNLIYVKPIIELMWVVSMINSKANIMERVLSWFYFHPDTYFIFLLFVLPFRYY